MHKLYSIDLLKTLQSDHFNDNTPSFQKISFQILNHFTRFMYKNFAKNKNKILSTDYYENHKETNQIIKNKLRDFNLNNTDFVVKFNSNSPSILSRLRNYEKNEWLKRINFYINLLINAKFQVKTFKSIDEKYIYVMLEYYL